MKTLRINSLTIPKRLTKKPGLKVAVMFLAALLILPLPTIAAQAQNPVSKNWTTVGSAGTVDEADADKVILDRGNVSLKGVLSSTTTTALAAQAQDLAEPAREEAEQSDAATAAALLIAQQTVKAVIRYNVTAVDGLFTNPSGQSNATAMVVRFRDNGSRAQVLARLIEYDLTTGSETVRLTFDSNQFPALAGYQTRAVSNCLSPTWQFDFQNKAYYVEATLISTAPLNAVLTGDPGLGIIQISNTICLF
jgi:hypothetical protein